MSRPPPRHLFLGEVDAVVQRFGIGWEALRGAKLFITGGTGYFGRWLLHVLQRANQSLALGMRVWVLTRSATRFMALEPELSQAPELTFLEGNILNYPLPEETFSHIIHGAATSAAATFYRQEDPLTKFDTTVEGTRRTLELAWRSNAGRVLMLSSGSYYGPLGPDQNAFAEGHAAAPDPADLGSAIGHGKRAAEFLCACYAERYGLSISTARCFSFVGPKLPLDLHYAIGNFIRDALSEPRIHVAGDGLPIRSYLYTGDLMVWLLTLLTRGQAGRAYNVGSDEAISISELARCVGRVLSPEKPVHIAGRPSESVKRNIYLPDISRAQSELGLQVWTSLDEAIRLTAEDAMNMTRADK